MIKPSTFIYSLYIAVSLHLSVTVIQASATKLTAPPLPHENTKDFANGEEVVIPPSATRFKRRPDARESEKLQKIQDAEDAKKAEEAKAQAAQQALKSRQGQLDAYQQQLKTAIDSNNQAVALGKAGRWQEAIDAHEKAVLYDPRNKQFKVNLSAARTAYGQDRMAKGDYTTAASFFRKALAAAPDNGLAGKCLSEAMKKAGLDPTSVDVRLKVGDQLAAGGDPQGAAIEYQAAMQMEPSARTYIKMGDTAYRYGQVSQAAEWYRQAIVKDPDYGPAHRQIGLLAMAHGDNTAAAASLRKAVSLDNKDVAASNALIDIWRKQVAANPLLAENHLGLAGALQITGDFNGADYEYRRLEALEPNNPGLEAGRASLARMIQHAKAEKHSLASTTLFNQGLKKEALEEINQAVMMEPKNSNYQFLLGECFESTGDYAAAHQAYLTCVLIDPENNKEAAARMKQMQQGMQQQQSSRQQMAPQQSPAQANMQQQLQQQAQPTNTQQANPGNYYRPPQSMTAPRGFGNEAAMNTPRKNMFEGGSGSPNMPGTMNFRTHDESDSAAAQQQPAGTAPGGAAPPARQDSISRLDAAEAQKDYAGAVTILRDMLTSNLQNADIHHRLAVDLMSSGEIGEAISEFRIASALSPKQKLYADDLARAMAIHKRSLTSDGAGAPQ